MVKTHPSYRDIVLYYPTEPLLLQITEWLRDHPYYHIRVVSSRRKRSVVAALESAAAALIDATDRPDAAMDALRHLVGANWPHPIVYTDHADEALELFVRVRGAIFLTGPVEAKDLTDLFGAAEAPLEARSPATSSRQGGRAPGQQDPPRITAAGDNAAGSR